MIPNRTSNIAEAPVGPLINRSRWIMPNNYSTTGNFGKLYPVYWEEMLPADEFHMNTTIFTRMQTPIHPTMDTAYMDLYFFAVPRRLLWKNWKRFMGENTESEWVDNTAPVSIPKISFPEDGWAEKTLADYLGLPTKVSDTLAQNKVDHAPFRAYCLIYNEWFRNQNTTPPTYFYDTDADTVGNNTGSAIYGGQLLNAERFPDLFSTCLPQPQKGPDVGIGLSGTVPVDYATTRHDISHSAIWDLSGTSYTPGMNAFLGIKTTADGKGMIGQTQTDSSGTWSTTNPSISNAIADLSKATSISINELRLAFQCQRFYERIATAGSRYNEMIYAFYGIHVPDERVQRPEYLGGHRARIQMQQVAQTSATNDITPQGNLAAYSLTIESGHSFDYVATEHCIIMGIAVARHQRSYQQGINKKWLRDDKFTFYNPAFAHIGNVPVENRELYFSDDITEAAKMKNAFGFQEAWYEYRYHPNIVTAELRSNATKTLDSWHYADKYNSLPTLSAGWMQETEAEVDRTIQVQSSVADQLLMTFHFENDVTRPMPVHSVPRCCVL